MLSEVSRESFAWAVFLHVEDSFSVWRMWGAIQDEGLGLLSLFRRLCHSGFVVWALLDTCYFVTRLHRFDSFDLYAWFMVAARAYTDEIATRDMRARRPNPA